MIEEQQAVTERIISYFGQLSGQTANVTVIFAIVFSALLLNFFWKKFHSRLQIQMKKTRNIWDDAVVEATRKPVTFVIWVMGLSLALEYAFDGNSLPYFSFLSVARKIALVLALAWFAMSFTMVMEKMSIAALSANDKKDATTIHAVSKLARVSIVITCILVVLQNLNVSISGVLAFGGIGGIAVGFAAKDLLANFFGGLIIYLDRPFSVGDWIRSPDRQLEGTVEHIGWRQTRIRTFDKRPLYVPNAAFNSIAVENPSRMLNRRIYETIGIRYEDSKKIAAIVQDVKAMLEVHPDIDQSSTMIVNFDAFAPSSLNFFVYTFTKTTDWIQFHDIKQDVLLKILEVIHYHDADVAFPTRTLHLQRAGDEV